MPRNHHIRLDTCIFDGGPVTADIRDIRLGLTGAGCAPSDDPPLLHEGEVIEVRPLSAGLVAHRKDNVDYIISLRIELRREVL